MQRLVAPLLRATNQKVWIGATTVFPYRQYFFRMGNQQVTKGNDPVYKTGEMPAPKVTFTEEELRAKLTQEEYNVTQNKGRCGVQSFCVSWRDLCCFTGTERAWTGKYVNVKEDGVFNCVVCNAVLFKSEKKFESGSGWPSFSDVAKQGNVSRIVDDSHGMVRTEVVCTSCGAHLGHVFEDGPQEDTGLRYCINSASLKFDPKKNSGKSTQDVASGKQEDTKKEDTKD